VGEGSAPRLLRAGAPVALIAVALAGCGSASHDQAAVNAGARTTTAPRSTPPSVRVTTTATSRRSTSRSRVTTHDPEAHNSFVQSRRTVHGPSAPTPDTLKPATTTPGPAANTPSPGAPSDAEIKRELKAMHQVLQAQRRKVKASTSGGEVMATGRARAPAGAPAAVGRIVAAGNAIARFPYVYGGGHASFVDTAYDCSGSVSYALAGAGLVHRPMTSGALAQWGDPGPGRWVTIYANAGHVWMTVAGLRFDTSGRSGVHGSRWQTAPRSTAGFAVRHPPGL
jgi:cell wall-associated NlpC family hydrolase